MLLVVGLTLLAGFLLACLALWGFQGRLIWFPARTLLATPADLHLPFEEVALATRDGVALHGWFIPADGARGAVLVCHGNAGNISDRIEIAERLRSLRVSTLLFDYRGYGKSAGAPSEEGTYLDAEAAFDWLAKRPAAPPIVAFGESLGGAVAVELARRRPLAGLITESTFTSLPELGAQLYPLLPVKLLARYRYASIEKAAEVRCPWLLLHSRADELVPFSHVTRLFEAASAAAETATAMRPPPRLVEIAGGHNDGGFLASGAGEAAVASFLDSVCGER
jgi:hypothetical protein